MPTSCQLRDVFVILVPCQQVDLIGMLVLAGSLFLYISVLHVCIVHLKCICVHNLSGELYFHLCHDVNVVPL